MASTNKTTHYELSQFLGTDKPAWLTDYNADMSKIDTGINSAQTTATGADGKADANTTAIGTLANLTTTAKTNLVSAINEVDANADTAQLTASEAAGTATSAKTEADNLVTYFNITSTGDCTLNVSGGNLNSTVSKVRYALNNDGTLGKIYGKIKYTSNVTTGGTLTITPTGLNVQSQLTIDSGCYVTSLESGSYAIVEPRNLTLNTNGTITIDLPSVRVGGEVTIWLPPCLYFFKDFGD